MLILLGVVSVFSLIVGSISAYLVYDWKLRAYMILALVVSILSLLSFPVMLVYFIQS